MPWTYADARDGGTFERVGGGPLDPVSGDWGQGAYNTDDISRAAVVYLRHWTSTGAESSRDTAYELLRSLAYFQTTTGPFAGNVVLWMQPDGDLNPSPVPVELPDPSDSGDSYWLARTLWALGEGYAAFEDVDPEFAAFLEERLLLGVTAVEREVLVRYGEYVKSDGVDVPAWLIVDGADATAEAVLGLSAYVNATADSANSGTDRAREALRKLSEGIAAMSAGDARSWPYGAVLPWAQSRSLWHAWASQMPAALAAASVTLDEPRLLVPAIADSVQFTPTLMTAGGPDNGWLPTPIDRVQIAYGVDSRLRSLLAVGTAGELPGLHELAGLMGSWYFGSNRAGVDMYDPATGVTFDGLQADGSVNRNSGAESTIHGQLSMIALDAHPEVRERATTFTTVTELDGLRVVEAETATSTDGTVITPESAWTGESQWGGNAYLQLSRWERATFNIGASEQERTVEPVSLLTEGRNSAISAWRTGRQPLGVLKHHVGEQGISPASGALLPQTLQLRMPAGLSDVTVHNLRGTLALDALIVRPLIGRVAVAATPSAGDGRSIVLLHSSRARAATAEVGKANATSEVRGYDASGHLVSETTLSGVGAARVVGGGFTVVVTG